VPPNPGLWGGIPLGFEGDRFENLWVMHSSWEALGVGFLEFDCLAFYS
jgi:hypothetical protein